MAVSAGVSGIAWYLGTLTTSGAVAAWSIGFLVLHGTGWSGGAVLAAFFGSSNLVSRWNPPPAFPGLDPKGDRRDAWQVYANGGPAAAAAILGPEAGLRVWVMTASLAAAAADTWATSVGARSRMLPRLLWSGRQVAAGTSGGVTLAGCAGAVVGAALVSGTGALLTRNLGLLPAGTLIGFLGMIVDSVIGGVWQGRFHCPRCDEPSEWRAHRCGTPTQWKGGLRWLTNDGVNFLATAFAAAVAWAGWYWIE